jgi:putative polyhydroxyalkanoate system protein
MADIVVRRHHDLGLARAKGLAQAIAQRLKEDYGGSFGWRGVVLHFERIGASGSVAVTRKIFEVHVELGFLLSPLCSRIEREIISFCDDHFAADDAAGRDRPTRRGVRRRQDTKAS